jgi:hypothetical protein
MGGDKLRDDERGMKHLIALLLAFVGYAHAASPSASLVASRTSGTAPLCVHFDATGSTDSDTTNPFRDLLYRWSFGDSGAGEWAYGANTSRSKNLARGAVAGHCYETAGTYTARLQVCDSTVCASATETITVTAADTTFSTTNTTCFYNSTVGSGCPTGATQTASSDFDAAVVACLANGKRCLFKRGDTFNHDTIISVSSTVTGAQIGAYGSGAKPIIQAASGIDFIRLSGTSSDIVIFDLDFNGAGLSDPAGGTIRAYSDLTNITLLRIVSRNHGAGIGFSGNGDTNRITGLFLVDSSIYAYTAGNAVYTAVKQSAFLGNFVDDARGPGYPSCASCAAEHGIRIQYGQKTVVSHNYLGRAAENKHQLTIRGAPRGNTGAVEDDNLDTNRVVVSENQFDDTTDGVQQVTFTPTSDNGCTWVRDVVFERNYVQSALSGATGVYISAVRVTVRNNIFEQNGTGSGAVAIKYTNTGTCSGDPVIQNPDNRPPPPENNWLGNNTLYRSGAVTSYNVMQIFGMGSSGATDDVTNTAIYNNLAYVPSASGTVTTAYTTGTAAGTTSGTNSTDSQARTTNPFGTTPSTPITFRPSTSAYAESGGTNLFPAVAEDFFLCRDRTAAVRYGALVPSARAQCAGVAQ